MLFWRHSPPPHFQDVPPFSVKQTFLHPWRMSNLCPTTIKGIPPPEPPFPLVVLSSPIPVHKPPPPSPISSLFSIIMNWKCAKVQENPWPLSRQSPQQEFISLKKKRSPHTNRFCYCVISWWAFTETTRTTKFKSIYMHSKLWRGFGRILNCTTWCHPY